MPRQLIDLGGGAPLLDISSYARHGPGRRDHLSPGQIAYIARTVHRTPEVMVKVLTHGARDLKAVARHIKYLARDGEVEIETDDGRRLEGKGVEKELLEDWDLDLDEARPTVDLTSRGTQPPPKLVQKLMFSMPAGTPPQKVLAAVKNFAREEFGAKHRYAMVLHTDEPHPHVHVIVKALSEDGQRLNIRKATLREWRSEFARHLREQGVAANATQRAARGATRVHKLDGIYRAAMRGVSTHHRRRTKAVARQLAKGTFKAEAGKGRVVATRRAVVQGWQELSEQLAREGQPELAEAVRRFAATMPPPLTEKEQIRATLLEKARLRAPIPEREQVRATVLGKSRLKDPQDRTR
jgi:Relaxase/Mobilisation nuclease domain